MAASRTPRKASRTPRPASRTPPAASRPPGKGRRKPAPAAPPIDRNAQLVRVLMLIADLCRLDGMDLYELAEKYDATTRTIRRDLDAIEAAGFELVSERDPAGKRRRWRIARDGYRRRLEQLLDVGHYLALRIAMDQAGPINQRSTMYAQLEDLSDTIESVLGSRQKSLLETINRCFHTYDKFAYREAGLDVLWPLMRAIDATQLCRVTYRAVGGGGKDRSYEVLPLKLFVYNRALYLHAHVPSHDNVIVLNLQRLVRLEPLEKKCAPPASYDPELLESSAFGVFIGRPPIRYRIRFTPAIAPYIRERNWHSSQELRELGKRGLELTFECSPSVEVDAWVASWRADAEVLEPASLREQMAALGERLQRVYRTG